jgi:hypothetical protein
LTKISKTEATELFEAVVVALERDPFKRQSGADIRRWKGPHTITVSEKGDTGSVTG